MKAILDEILERLAQAGPVRLYVSEAEYEVLRTHVGGRWTGGTGWASFQRDRLLLLAFLRGYTFYREPAEHDDAFWESFCMHLGRPFEALTNAQYDALWEVLGSHPETERLRYREHGRRQFVGSIGRIWGIHSLSTERLVTFFQAYYNYCPNAHIDEALMRRLLPGAGETELRQAGAYDRIFRHLTAIADHILDTDPALARRPPEELCPLLESAGLTLGSPNPVLFFWNKSPGALARAVGAVQGGVRRRYQLRGTRTLVPARRQPEQFVTVTLASSYSMVGEPLTVQLERQGWAGERAELHIEALNRRVPVMGDEARIEGLPEGQHQAELLVNGQRVGRELMITVLPAFEVTPTRRRGALVEGQAQVGEVRLHDGRFGTFAWKPQWHGDQPRVQQVTVTLDEALRVELQVSAQSYGARVCGPDGCPLKAPLSPGDLQHAIVMPLRPAGKAPPELRVSLESHPGETFAVQGGQHLEPLTNLTPGAFDRVLVEVKIGNDWQRALGLEYRLRPRIQAVEDDGAALLVQVLPTRRLTLDMIERWPSGETLRHTFPVTGHTLRAPLHISVPGLARQVQLCLRGEDGSIQDERSHSSPPEDLNEQLGALLRGGLGWARLRG